MAPAHSLDLELAEKSIRDIARSCRMSLDDAADFSQFAQLKLLERRQDVMRQFAGRCSVPTYLASVCGRLRIDWQRTVHGTWRPSAAARRLGPMAVEIDRRVHRDGETPAAAIAGVRARHPEAAEGDLWRLISALPPNYRRRFVSDAAADARLYAGFEDPLERRDIQRALHETAAALRRALRSLSADDRALLHARFAAGRTIQALARERGHDPRPLYRHFQRLLLRLRRHMEQAGVTASVRTCGSGRRNGHARQTAQPLRR